MILVDTSVWIDHFRNGNQALASRLEAVKVVSHPFVAGELACGNLVQRTEILALLAALPEVTVASHSEVLAFIEMNRLMGLGIGWIDAHLLCSARLDRVGVWTLDKKLDAAAESLGVRTHS